MKKFLTIMLILVLAIGSFAGTVFACSCDTSAGKCDGNCCGCGTSRNQCVTCAKGETCTTTGGALGTATCSQNEYGL